MQKRAPIFEFFCHKKVILDNGKSYIFDINAKKYHSKNTDNQQVAKKGKKYLKKNLVSIKKVRTFAPDFERQTS